MVLLGTWLPMLTFSVLCFREFKLQEHCLAGSSLVRTSALGAEGTKFCLSS